MIHKGFVGTKDLVVCCPPFTQWPLHVKVVSAFIIGYWEISCEHQLNRVDLARNGIQDNDVVKGFVNWYISDRELQFMVSSYDLVVLRTPYLHRTGAVDVLRTFSEGFRDTCEATGVAYGVSYKLGFIPCRVFEGHLGSSEDETPGAVRRSPSRVKGGVSIGSEVWLVWRDCLDMLYCPARCG